MDDAVAVWCVFFPFSHPDELRISTAAEELRRGLPVLQFQDAAIDRACKHAPRPEWLGHRDIFNWGEKLVTTCLDNPYEMTFINFCSVRIATCQT